MLSILEQRALDEQLAHMQRAGQTILKKSPAEIRRILSEIGVGDEDSNDDE